MIKIANGLNLRGPKLSFLFIGDQNCNFLKLRGWEKYTLAKNNCEPVPGMA